MNIINKVTMALTVSTMVLLSGCHSRGYTESVQETENLQVKVREQDNANDYQFVKHSGKWFVPKLKQSRKDMPDWCYSPQQLGVFKDAPINLILQELTKTIPVNVVYGNDVDSSKRITVALNRDVCDGLEKVSLASGYSYTINDSKITLKALEDKTVSVAFAPGVNKYFLGKEKNTGGSSSEQGAGGSSTVAVTSESLTNASGFKGVEAELDPWTNLVSVLAQMKSEKGFIGPNPVASNILLRDTPEHVNAMEKYILGLNRAVNRVLSIEFQVIEVTTTDGEENGLNVQNIIKQFDGGNKAVTFGTEFANNILTDTNSPLLDIAFTQPAEGQSESLLIKALAQHGQVSVSRGQRVITLNNQVVRLKEVVNDTYLAQSKKDSTANVGATDELIPGTVQSGLDMYALAREYDGFIQLHLSANISNLLSIGEVSSGESKIQTPSVGEREFDTMAFIPPNKSLLLTGLTTSRNETAYQGTLDDKSGFWPFTDLFGYTRGGKKSRTETIILVNASVVYKES
ncbi:hypothetical protein [Shewanella aestuarii]|uniref:Type II/III secretion system secretin-like domain-containing protein n=1 Tax=Shewanella aestuarii TaxID=1028752 RepID=A0A6G9QPP7_9GAMM|nr:hypothetical protein [Shewanella aestuarii]QIR16536.1 hypothetical protein HBH39_18845 [Shewanella aestuarii]